LPFGNLIGLTAAYLLRIKKRFYTSSNEFWAQDYKSRKQEFIDKISIKLSSKIITQTSLPNEFLVKKYNIKAEKITTIWHSLKIEDYLNIDKKRIDALRNKYNIQESDFVVGKIARFESWKGHKYLVESLKDLKEFSNIKLFLFGKGETLEEIKQMVKDYELEKNVFFTDFERDIIGLYQVFDIHVHVPVHKFAESFGLTIIEGMISGCPQILTLSGISNETAKDKENCLLVDYCSSEEITSSIKLLYLNDKLRDSIARNAKSNAVNLFNYCLKVDKHIKLYQ
jgi:glycosyltransferase involved in cell wall biosynthesis